MAATDQTLSELHAALAAELHLQLQPREVPITDAEGKNIGTRIERCSPAVLGAVITFLKNNSITADPVKNSALQRLDAALKNRKSGKISSAALDQAAREFSEAHLQ